MKDAVSGVPDVEAASLDTVRRKVVVTAAQQLAQMRQIDLNCRAQVLQTREQETTERVRVAEEERTRRLERLAAAAESICTERNRTQRERELLRAKAQREALAAIVAMEAKRIQSRGLVNMGLWALASVIGAVSIVRRPAARGVGMPALRVGPRSSSQSTLLPALLTVMLLQRVWHPSAQHIRQSPLGMLFQSGMTGLVLNMAKAMLGRSQTAAQNEGMLEGCLRSPDVCSEGWVSTEGKSGRVFWHHASLGPAPWEASHSVSEDVSATSCDVNAEIDVAPSSCSTSASQSVECCEPPLSVCAPDASVTVNSCGLGEYVCALEEHGYDQDVLSMLQEHEVEEMLELIDCKPGHRVRFRRMLRELRALRS